VTGRDWRAMTRADFDTAAGTVQGALLPAPDPVGTGDLFELIAPPGANRPCLDCGVSVCHELTGQWRAPWYDPCVTTGAIGHRVTPHTA
jgi:hypothetical protein